MSYFERPYFLGEPYCYDDEFLFITPSKRFLKVPIPTAISFEAKVSIDEVPQTKTKIFYYDDKNIRVELFASKMYWFIPKEIIDGDTTFV